MNASHSPRDIVTKMLQACPEAEAVPIESHLSLEVTGKRFAWFLDDHHGDGRESLHVKSTKAQRQKLLDEFGDVAFVPSHVGRFGWIGFWLDGKSVDWPAIRAVLREGYQLVAPKRLLRVAADNTGDSP